MAAFSFLVVNAVNPIHESRSAVCVAPSLQAHGCIARIDSTVVTVVNNHLSTLATSKQDRDITLLYKVEPGVSDRSYGIHVAELANFPPAVIRLAKRKAEELEDFEDDEDDVNLNNFDPETTKQGAKVVEDFLRAFAQRSKRAKESVDGQGQAEVLRELKKEWQPTFAENAWLKALVEGL